MRKLLLLIILMFIAVAATVTPQEMTSGPGKPQVIEFSNGKAALCVNCPYITELENGVKQIICKDQEQTCDLYFGFVKTKEQEYTQDGKKYTYQFPDSDEFSTKENNFIIKSVTVESAVSAQSYLDMPDGRENILKEIEGKAVSTASKDAYYKLDSLVTADYALIQDAIITINSQGEIAEVIGTAKKAAKQRLISMIDEKARVEAPLKNTEKLTFRGLDSKEGYKFLEPVLEVYNPDKRDQSFEKWLTLIDEEYKAGTNGGAFIDKLCGTDIFYYAPGSKFQIKSPTGQQECNIKRYLLTTGISKGNTDLWQYKCGELTYIAEPGKLNDLYCDQDKSEINCRGNKNCQKSQFRIKISDKDTIELGTNRFITDSKFEFAKKGNKPYLLELKTEEIKVGRDYIFPADSLANVLPVEADIKGLENPKGFSVLEVDTGTYIIREWASEDLMHKLLESTDGKDVKYKVGIYEGSDDLSTRFAVVYPSNFFSYGKETLEEEKEIRSANLPDTGRVNIPTLGIKLEQFQTLDRMLEGGQGFAFDIKYHAMSKEDLEKRKQKTKTTYTGTKIDVKERDNLYDVLAEYCIGTKYTFSSEESNEQFKIKMKAVEEIAQKMMDDAKNNPDSPNAEILSKKYDHQLMAKDGKLMLPSGEITFTQDDKTQVTVIPPRCNIMTGADRGYTIRRTIGGKLEAGRQTCGKGASHKVQTGDSLKQIYEMRCTDDYKGSTKPLQFKQWVLNEANNPGLAERKTWHDKIFPGDEICIPDECDTPQVVIGQIKIPGEEVKLTIGKPVLPKKTAIRTEGLTIPLKIECPVNEFDCEEGAQNQQAYMTEEQQCEAYSDSLKPCLTRCAWLTSGKNTGACVPASSVQTDALKNFRNKANNYAKQGKKVPESISQFVEAKYAPQYEEQDVRFVAAGRGPGSTIGRRIMSLGEKPEETGIPEIDITVEPKIQDGDYTVKKAVIPAERISCTYMKKNRERITLTNTEDHYFVSPPPSKTLKDASKEIAIIAASNYYQKLIPEVCKALVQDGNLKYNSNQWRVLER